MVAIDEIYIVSQFPRMHIRQLSCFGTRGAAVVIAIFALTSWARAQIISMSGTIAYSAGVFPTLNTVQVGDPVHLSFELIPAFFNQDTEFQGRYSGITLSLKLGNNPIVEAVNANVILLANSPDIYSPSGGAWGIGASGIWWPGDSSLGAGIVVAGLSSSNNVGNTLMDFPSGIPISAFDLSNTGGMFLLPDYTSYAIWTIDSYSVTPPGGLQPIPEPSTYGWSGLLVIFAGIIHSHRRTKQRFAKA